MGYNVLNCTHDVVCRSTGCLFLLLLLAFLLRFFVLNFFLLPFSFVSKSRKMFELLQVTTISQSGRAAVYVWVHVLFIANWCWLYVCCLISLIFLYNLFFCYFKLVHLMLSYKIIFFSTFVTLLLLLFTHLSAACFVVRIQFCCRRYYTIIIITCFFVRFVYKFYNFIMVLAVGILVSWW